MPEAYTAWREHVQDEASVAFTQAPWWSASHDSYAVGCRFYLVRADRGDLDNLLGGVLDALNAFAWKDDRLVTGILFLEKHVEPSTPRVEVALAMSDTRGFGFPAKRQPKKRSL